MGERAQQQRNLRGLLGSVFAWLVVVSTASFGFLCIKWLVWVSAKDQGLREVGGHLFRDHFPAIVGLPAISVAAMFLVLILKVTEGPIEFEGLGFRLKGSAGEVVLWLACFLGMAAALRLLWPLHS